MNSTARNPFVTIGLLAATLLSSATAQETNTERSEHARIAAKTIIHLWPGIAPGSEQWRQPETTIGSVGNQRVMNVSSPTLTVYLPDPSTATGTSVIIAPGGGFVLAVD